MWTPFLMRWPNHRSRRNSLVALCAPLAFAVGAAPTGAHAQLVVFDPKNHLENALQAARQLESLANEARALTNQARELAASPYSHLGAASGTLQEIGDLAQSVRGLAGDLQGLEADFSELYPAVVEGLDPGRALAQSRARNVQARETAQDLARIAAELDRLSRGRTDRLAGALRASQDAQGQTAAIQSSTQMLAVLAEDLGSMRALLMAQSRLLAADSARRAAERSAGVEARRQFWGGAGAAPANPAFNPLRHSRR